MCGCDGLATETRCWIFNIPPLPTVTLVPRLSLITLLGIFEVVALRNLYLYLPIAPISTRSQKRKTQNVLKKKHQGITVPMRNFPITVESSQKISIHVIQKVYLQQSKASSYQNYGSSSEIVKSATFNSNLQITMAFTSEGDRWRNWL